MTPRYYATLLTMAAHTGSRKLRAKALRLLVAAIVTANEPDPLAANVEEALAEACAVKPS